MTFGSVSVDGDHHSLLADFYVTIDNSSYLANGGIKGKGGKDKELGAFAVLYKQVDIALYQVENVNKFGLYLDLFERVLFYLFSNIYTSVSIYVCILYMSVSCLIHSHF